MTAPDHLAETNLNSLYRRGPSTYELCNGRVAQDAANYVKRKIVNLAAYLRGAADHRLVAKTGENVQPLTDRPLAHDFE
jgi:hypothetical protein